jgi:hypothetical protein
MVVKIKALDSDPDPRKKKKKINKKKKKNYTDLYVSGSKTLFGTKLSKKPVFWIRFHG